MAKRTAHGAGRHAEGDRPTSEALADRASATEIYLDIESRYYIFVGARGRTHIFTIEGRHHTSFRTTLSSRRSREQEGKWERIERERLPDGLK
jgi:hypothetical protein